MGAAYRVRRFSTPRDDAVPAVFKERRTKFPTHVKRH